LQDSGLQIVAVALDADEKAVVEWATKETITFPVLIDKFHIVADLYGFVNVPAAIWIDENDKIVRPADGTPGSDLFRSFSNVDSEVHHNLLRSWVRNNVRDLDDVQVRDFQLPPTQELQNARLHRRIAIALRDRGKPGDDVGSQMHFALAEKLAPLDWTIRRGNMPLVGVDPFGDEFFKFVGEWSQAGRPGYKLGTGRETKPETI
jgi:hypothetical protein